MTNILKDFKNKISLKEFEVTNTSSFPTYSSSGVKSFDSEEAEKNLHIKIEQIDNTDMEFDMIGYDTAIPNAIRRILLSEVPSMAIEKVHMYQNTSIMQDEVLAHRLGLIPLKADPRLFSWKEEGADDEGTEEDTLEFQLKIRCSKSNGSSQDEPYVNEKVLTEHIQWVAKGDQANRLTADQVGPTHPDILVNKLRLGHEMEITMFAVKGIGRDHAKFSPVATAFYRLLPSITLLKPVVGEAAVRLQKCFSPGVIELEPGEEGKKKAVVTNPRLDTCSRNVYRYDDLKESVSLDKVKDHFIFTVESVGAVSPQDLVVMACDVLIEKCDHFIQELESSESKS